MEWHAGSNPVRPSVKSLMRDGLGVFRGRLLLLSRGSYSNRYSNADRLGAGATVGETEHNLVRSCSPTGLAEVVTTPRGFPAGDVRCRWRRHCRGWPQWIVRGGLRHLADRPRVPLHRDRRSLAVKHLTWGASSSVPRWVAMPVGGPISGGTPSWLSRRGRRPAAGTAGSFPSTV